MKTFSAADIEKYWSGKLNATEMHVMEQAAMDDPFLADAMEGYKNTATVASDLNTLGERLDKRIALAPVVSLKQKKFLWLKVAAVIIIVGGTVVLVQQFVFNNSNESPIADSRSKEIQKPEADTNNNHVASPASGDIQGNLQTIPSDSPSNKTRQTVPDNLSAKNSDNTQSTDTLNFSASRAAKDFKKTEDQRKDSSTGNVVATAEAESLTQKLEKRSLNKPGVAETSGFRDYDKNAAPSKGKSMEGVAVGRNFGANFTNKYNYRVVDAQNNPVPFANVMNTIDNVGTYTDIRGNFNLVSSDSVLNVQIKSLGYVSNTYTLVPSSQFRSLTLQDDHYARKQVQDSSRQLVSNAVRKDTAELEEPEVGWGNFNTYVANNMQIPDNTRKKSTLRNVELSFDVDKAGHPVNIKVIKSSQCKECDEEAKRLLKEGPKWKKKGKRSKTTLFIAIDQK